MTITKRIIGAPKGPDNITTIGEEIKYILMQLREEEPKQEYQTEFNFSHDGVLSHSPRDKSYHEYH